MILPLTQHWVTPYLTVFFTQHVYANDFLMNINETLLNTLAANKPWKSGPLFTKVLY